MGKKRLGTRLVCYQPALLGPFLAVSGHYGRTFPAFGELQVTHEVIGQVHEANLDFGTSQSDGADEFPPHAVFLKAEDVLDPGTDLGTFAVVGLLLVSERVGTVSFFVDPELRLPLIRRFSSRWLR